MAGFDKEGGSSTSEGKGPEMENLKGGIKQLKTEIEIGEFEGLIIGRSKSQQEIDTQIEQLDEEFQKEA